MKTKWRNIFSVFLTAFLVGGSSLSALAMPNVCRTPLHSCRPLPHHGAAAFGHHSHKQDSCRMMTGASGCVQKQAPCCHMHEAVPDHEMTMVGVRHAAPPAPDSAAIPAAVVAAPKPLGRSPSASGAETTFRPHSIPVYLSSMSLLC